METTRNALPLNAALAVVLQVRGGSLCVLLWRRARDPHSGSWALPGGALSADEALELSLELGTRLVEVWAGAALGELEAGGGDVKAATRFFEQLERLLEELDFKDVDVHPGPELVDGYIRLGRHGDAERVAGDFGEAGGLDIGVEVDGEAVPLPMRVEAGLLRIAQGEEQPREDQRQRHVEPDPQAGLLHGGLVGAAPV